MDQRVRVALVTAFVVLLAASLGVQAVTIDRGTTVEQAEGAYPGNTLVGVHSWSDEGKVVEITPNGTVAWEWSVPDSRVFAVEQLDEETVLAAVAVRTPAEDCEEQFLEYEKHDDHCVTNRVVEIDKESGDVVWEYAWQDQFIGYHEVHDVERLENGETAIADMGNDRAFTVDREGTITWEWRAEDHLTPGTDFYEAYGGPIREGPHDDWTHMNDIDVLANGNVQLSVRNFDVVIEVDPDTNEIVDVVGEPGNHTVLERQHNPHRIEDAGTMVVADSSNDRIVELDVETESTVWEYTGPSGSSLQWPRDADRLPNGNTLVTDSRNNRILEVDASGEVVWQYEDPDGEVIPLPYEADRIGAEERGDVPSGRESADRHETAGPIVETVRHTEGLSKYVVPTWMHLPQLLHLVGIGAGLVWLGVEGVLFGLRRHRRP
ncbi:MAG: aryl-sulfate sulfotransferase [Halanaeroarchaeum sp.]